MSFSTSSAFIFWQSSENCTSWALHHFKHSILCTSRPHLCSFLLQKLAEPFPFFPHSRDISICFQPCRQGEGLHCWPLEGKLAIVSPRSVCFTEVGSDLTLHTFCYCRTVPGFRKPTALQWALLPQLPAQCSSAAQRLTWSMSLCLHPQGSLFSSPNGYFSSHFFWSGNK